MRQAFVGGYDYEDPHISPELRSLEAFKLESGRWTSLGVFADAAKVRVQPFDAVEIELSFLWAK